MNGNERKHISVYCAVTNCKNNSSNFTGSFFRFPKDQERAQHWARLCKREDLLRYNVILNNIRLCAEHFEDTMYRSPIKKRLNSLAFPKIFKTDEDESRIRRKKMGFSSEILIAPSTSKSEYYEDVLVLPGTSKTFNVIDEKDLLDVDLLKEELDLPVVDESENSIPSIPIPSSPILSPVGTQTSEYLMKKTPRKEKYRNKIEILDNKIKQLQHKVNVARVRVKDEDKSIEMFFSLCDKYLTPTQSSFMKLQAKQADRFLMGR